MPDLFVLVARGIFSDGAEIRAVHKAAASDRWPSAARDAFMGSL